MRRLASLVLVDILLVLLAFLLFWSITRFFFAQDDFVFLERAAQGFGASVGAFFDGTAGHFRPLTKGLYFFALEPIFGFNAVPYHVVSILLHGVNAVLVGVLLRHLGASFATSRFVAALFVLNVGYLEAVAWISCAQQLVSELFFISSLIFGVVALEGGARRPRWISAVLFALALGSYEQTCPLPLVLVLWEACRRGLRAAMNAVRGWLWIHLALLAAYLVFVLGWRGAPDTGPYVMSVGANVLENLRAYTGLVFELWIRYPPFGVPLGMTVSHGVWMLVIGYLLGRGRFRELAFGVGSFLLLVLPVLFQSEHTLSFHVYVPAIGAWFLAAVMVDDILGMLRSAWARRVQMVFPLLAVACFVPSLRAVEYNVSTKLEPIDLPQFVVFRRATIAERMWKDLQRKVTGHPDQLALVSLTPQHRPNWLNVHAALGQGSAVRLALGPPFPEVVFVPPSDPDAVDESTVVLYYTVRGEVLWYEEVIARSRELEAADSTRAP